MSSLQEEREDVVEYTRNYLSRKALTIGGYGKTFMITLVLNPTQPAAFV